MKKLVILALIVCWLVPAAKATAQTPTECSSIEQKYGEAPVITGSSSPANILTQVVDADSFLFVAKANPGYSLNFYQLVYIDSVGTHIVMPDIASHTLEWSITVTGTLDFYKVSGCLAQQATTTMPPPPLPIVCPQGQHGEVDDAGVAYCVADENDQAFPPLPIICPEGLHGEVGQDGNEVCVANGLTPATPIKASPAFTG